MLNEGTPNITQLNLQHPYILNQGSGIPLIGAAAVETDDLSEGEDEDIEDAYSQCDSAGVDSFVSDSSYLQYLAEEYASDADDESLPALVKPPTQSDDEWSIDEDNMHVPAVPI